MSAEWEKLNQAYWDAWKALAEAASPDEAGARARAGGTGSTAANPWSDVLDQWWGMAQAAVPGMAGGRGAHSGRDAASGASGPQIPGFALFNQMVEQSRQMFGFAEMLRDAFDDRSDAPPVERFAQSLRDAIGGWRMANRAAEFAVPFMQWPLAPPVQGGFNPFASFAQGPSPAGGARFRLNDDWDPATFTRVFNDYHQALNAVAEQQFKALEKAVGELPNMKLPEGPEASAGAMRGFYERWLEACDDALGDLSASENYGEQFGALVNAYLRLQQMLWQPVEDPQSNSDRERIEALESAVSEMTASMSALHAGLGEIPLSNMVAHVGVLTDEMHELRDALESLKTETGAVESKPSSPSEPPSGNQAASAARPRRTASKKAAASRAVGEPRAKKTGKKAPPADPFDIGNIDDP